MATPRFVGILAASLLVGACGEAPPSPDAAASVDPMCVADITVTGGYEGSVKGSVVAAPRRIAADGRGVSIDAFLDMPQSGDATRFTLSVFDADGPDGPKPINALFGEVEPGLTSLGWGEGLDPNDASLAADGSTATFDLELGRIGVGPASRVRASIECPALP